MEKETKPKKKNILIGCGLLVVLVIIIAVAMGTCLGGEPEEEIELSASVSFEEGQFTITNNDSFAWRNVRFYLNSDYELYHSVIEANSTYTVGAMQFAKSDGTMFNPFTQKPLTMSIAGDNPEGKRRWWHGGWK